MLSACLISVTSVQCLMSKTISYVRVLTAYMRSGKYFVSYIKTFTYDKNHRCILSVIFGEITINAGSGIVRGQATNKKQIYWCQWSCDACFMN